MPLDDDGAEVAPDDDGVWQDGGFAYFFFYVGQGNCCLIVCPDKTLIIIDCGSLARFPVATAPRTIRDRILMYTGTDDYTIDYVILTHSDRDHYSRLYDVLYGFEIKVLLISSATAASPLYYYDQRSTSKDIYDGNLEVGEIREVTINRVKRNVRIWTDPFTIDELDDDNPIAGFSYNVANGIYNGTNWTVDIIAGNVGYDEKQGFGEDPKKINAASLVTLVTYGAHKYINPGDATADTERFLLDNDVARKNAIQNVSLALVSHHGSDDESNTPAYVNWINAQQSIVSVQTTDRKYFDPKLASMSLYLAKVQNTSPQHAVDTWERAAVHNVGRLNAADAVVEKWKREGLDYTVKGYYYTLDTIPAAGGVYIAVPWKGLMLKRTITTKNLFNGGTSDAAGLSFLFFSYNP